MISNNSIFSHLILVIIFKLIKVSFSLYYVQAFTELQHVYY